VGQAPRLSLTSIWHGSNRRWLLAAKAYQLVRQGDEAGDRRAASPTLAWLALAILLLGNLPLSAQPISTERSVIATGGGLATADRLTLTDTLGQATVGRSASANYAVDAGFWPDPGRPPVPGGFSLSTYRNVQKTFLAAKLTRAAQDPDDDAIQFTAVSPGSTGGGTVQLSGGQVTYSPPPSYVGGDAFTYTLGDGWGGTATGTVSVTVEAGGAIAVDIFRPVESNGTFSVRFAGVPGRIYTIERMVLPSPTWDKMTNMVAPTTSGSYGVGLFEFSESSAGATGIRFYRIVSPPY
jgi:hypothetical protein